MIKTTEFTLPSHWASALINDDWTGYEDDEIQQIQDVLQWLGLKSYYCFDLVEDHGFMQCPSYYSSTYGLLDGDYSTFSFVQR